MLDYYQHGAHTSLNKPQSIWLAKFSTRCSSTKKVDEVADPPTRTRRVVGEGGQTVIAPRSIILHYSMIDVVVFISISIHATSSRSLTMPMASVIRYPLFESFKNHSRSDKRRKYSFSYTSSISRHIQRIFVYVRNGKMNKSHIFLKRKKEKLFIAIQKSCRSITLNYFCNTLPIYLKNLYLNSYNIHLICLTVKS